MKWKRVCIFALVVILLGLLSIFQPYLTGERINQQYEKEGCFVNRIIDGDTLVCNNETIRLLGIDTPERGETYYQEAKDFLMQVENQDIYILRDWDNRGKYYRKLRYIFYENRLLNIEILEKGLGKAFMTEKLKYEDKLLDAEKFAKDNRLGIWEGECN